MRKVSRNEICPCGSGKKYKKCCIGKEFEWVKDEDGNIFREVKLNEDLREAFEYQRKAFIEKHGREWGPDDKIFFDAPPTEHLEHETVQAMKEAGIRPAIIYAYEKTGRLVTEDNKSMIPDNALAEWNAAVEEYYELHGDEE